MSHVGLVASLSVGGFFIALVFFGVPATIAVVTYCKARRRNTVQSPATTNTPTTSSTITSNPTPTHPQPEYRDAKFSFGEAPPSYDAATTYPSYTAPVYSSHAALSKAPVTDCHPQPTAPYLPQEHHELSTELVYPPPPPPQNSATSQS
ncbi:hypothetical protein GBAR_LOCUS12494 [Geodia barretti]|uniref:Uncharacterized protein n=1 Tax=Geodia barretti TaxID=519541 RepID=A0AA35S2P3_GEOBA|nr:hypothetical protein GBAR_LOCUS12494 [Geodia barretti]